MRRMKVIMWWCSLWFPSYTLKPSDRRRNLSSTLRHLLILMNLKVVGRNPAFLHLSYKDYRANSIIFVPYSFDHVILWLNWRFGFFAREFFLQWHSVTAVIGCSVSRCAIQSQTQWYQQTILQLYTTKPPAVINCDTLSVFKSGLKTHLFHTAYS